jgi:hypothetical protein
MLHLTGLTVLLDATSDRPIDEDILLIHRLKPVAIDGLLLPLYLAQGSFCI